MSSLFSLRIYGAAAIWLAAGILGTATAESPGVALHEAAQRAVREHLPTVAVAKLRACLELPDISGELRASANLLLAEALGEEGDIEEALAAVQPLAVSGNAAAWEAKGEILLGAGRWSDALEAYEAACALPECPVSCLAGKAEALRMMGRLESAESILNDLVSEGKATCALRLRLADIKLDLDKVDEARTILAASLPTIPEDAKWKKHIEARILLAQDQPAPARVLFEEVLGERDHLPESLLFAGTYGATDARIALYGYSEADDVLEKFIGKHSSSPYLGQAFHRLDEIYMQEENVSESELQRWATKPPDYRMEFALFYLGKTQLRKGQIDKAAQSLQVFLSKNATHPLAARAYLMESDIFTARGQLDSAVSALDAALRLTKDPALRAQLELRAGLVHYQRGEDVLAAEIFRSVAQRSPALQEIASFDAALAWLNQRNFERFSDEFRSFAALQPPPSDLLKRDLVLEKGLLQARSGDSDAAETLRLYIGEYPKSNRVSEAYVALAELAFLSPDRGNESEAVDYLKKVQNNESPNPEMAAHSKYLAIFMADADRPRSDEKVIQLATNFLKEYPESSLVPEVQMKLGQIFFRKGDCANAETQFATLAQTQPDGPYAETALFLAGESAGKLPGGDERALDYFDQVVKIDKSLNLFARQEQALVLQKKPDRIREAIVLYDIILSAIPPAPEALRQASLCAKGENLLLLGKADPSQTAAAIAVFDELADLPDVLPEWRNQALFKKGSALAAQGKTELALVAYYDVLDKTANADRHEYFWYYKAGFRAVETFEQRAQWKAAAAVYDKMAAINGPRTAEVRDKAKKLRLEHFLWE